MCLSNATTVPTPDKWLPWELKDLIRRKRITRRLAQRTLTPRDISAANALSAEMRRSLDQCHQKKRWKRISSSSIEDGSVWRLARMLRRGKQAPGAARSIQGPNGATHDEDSKTEVLADFIQSTHTQDDDSDSDYDIANKVDSVIGNLPNLRGEKLRPAKIEEIKAFVKTRKKGKAPGPDHIPIAAILRLPDSVLQVMVTIVNAILRLGHFPQVWKQAIVADVLKRSQDPGFLQNYRPISLLSNLSKVTEAFILRRLQEELLIRNVVQDEQFGFREGLSTDFQCFRVADAIRNSFETRETMGAVFLDFARAFETVWHHGLVYEMVVAGFNPQIIKVVWSYLQDRSFMVRVGESLWSSKDICTGVPQGSMLGPV